MTDAWIRCAEFDSITALVDDVVSAFQHYMREDLMKSKARKTARMYGTPVYVWKNGKIVAGKP